MDSLAFLERPLRGEPRPVYVLYGDEDFLKRAALAVLRPFVLGSDDADFGLTTVAGDRTGYAAVHDELALLVRAGLTPLEALRSATSNPAQYFAATDSLGSIAPGRIADLVLLDGNPLADIANTRRVAVVVANGRVYDEAARRSLFAAAERAARR